MDFEKLIYVVVGAIIGFTLSLAKDWLMESKKQKEKEKQFKREKLEKAFILLNDYNNKVTSPELKPLSDGEYNPAELSMIIHFYFRNIKEPFGEYVKNSSEFSLKLKIDHDGEGVKDIFKEYGEIVKLLIEESKKL